MKGESEFSFIQSNGKTHFNFNIYFGNIKLTFNIGFIEKIDHIITKFYDEMDKSFVEILNNIDKELIVRNQSYSNITIHFEKNISEIIDKKYLYDFSYEFKNPINKLINEAKNFSSNLSDDLLILIDNALSNCSLILDDINLDIYIKEFREITKYEYNNFINSVTNSLDDFSKNVLLYIGLSKNLIDKKFEMNEEKNVSIEEIDINELEKAKKEEEIYSIKNKNKIDSSQKLGKIKKNYSNPTLVSLSGSDRRNISQNGEKVNEIMNMKRNNKKVIKDNNN
jgi:hypothetical protein